jgi:MOSC domain-containing protein YiiM
MATVLALSTAPAYGSDLVARESISLIGGKAGGVEGDRHLGKKRAVTVVCTGELARAAADHGVDAIDGFTTRRNIVVDTESLPREHGARFTIGETELEVWRDCAPCELMNEFFGDGARTALKERCGISASVVRGGTVRIGDTITFI